MDAECSVIGHSLHRYAVPLKVNCPEGAREATLGCPLTREAWVLPHQCFFHDDISFLRVKNPPTIGRRVCVYRLGTGVGRSGSKTSSTLNRSATFLGVYHIR